MEKKTKKLDASLEVIEFSKYTKPVVEPSISTKWTLNGDNNSFFKYVKQCYEGSVTNQAIINGFVNYIYGEGLVSNKENFNVYKYISRKDVRLMTLDFKTYGGYAVQVIWNRAEKLEDKKPVLFKYFPIYKLGLNIDKKTLQVNGYWYSYDWENSSKYKPQFFQKFDGNYKFDEKNQVGYDVELFVVQRASSDPFFANPDYLPGLQYAELEMELANSSINHIKNGFQATKVINVPFVPETEEAREEMTIKLKSQTTGTNQTNQALVQFNSKPEQKLTVDTLEITELNQQYVHFDEVSEKKLIVAHSAPPILFSGSREGGGLGNNSEEIETATKMLYRKTINPMREDFLDGLEYLFKEIDSNIQLSFKDFEEFNGQDTEGKTIEEPKKQETV